MNEKDLLLSRLADKLRLCRERDCIEQTAFLDAASLSEAKRFCAAEKARASFFGGYENAERVLCVFIPDFYPEEMFPSFFYEQSDEAPIKALRCTWAQGSPVLSHRDILGSVLALGIERETVGDILVSESSADVFVLSHMAEFILSDYKKAGRVPLSIKEIPLSEVRVPEQNVERKRDTVASMRLDGVLSAIFSLSRSKADEAVALGIVFVNDVRASKPDAPVKDGDKVVLRGMGKAKIVSSDGVSKKGRIVIIFDKYK